MKRRSNHLLMDTELSCVVLTILSPSNFVMLEDYCLLEFLHAFSVYIQFHRHIENICHQTFDNIQILGVTLSQIERCSCDF